MNKNTEAKENYIFVELLKKYNMYIHKYILKRKRSRNNSNRMKQKAAQIALTIEFNEKCNTKLCVAHILNKLNNFKYRLRKNNFKSLCGNKNPHFSALEERFLSLWDDNGIDFCTNNSLMKTDITGTTDKPSCFQYPHMEDCNESIEEGPSQATTELSTLKNWDLESDFESESSLNDFDDND